MSENTESHTIKLLQEMRREMREGFAEMNARFSDVDARFDDVNTRIDGMTHMMTLLAGHSHNMEERLTEVENAQGDTH